MVRLVTCSHTCHMWSNLSHVVTCSHTYHPSSHCHMWSHKVTLVTYDHTCHKKSIFQQLTKKCIRCLMTTRPTYRPAWPQVKMVYPAVIAILFFLTRALKYNCQQKCPFLYSKVQKVSFCFTFYLQQSCKVNVL